MSIPIRYDPTMVLLSIAVAIFTLYAGLEIAGRVRRAADREAAALWVAIGSLTVGCGLWSMHFIGMAAAELNFTARYETGGTAASWLAAVLVSALVLGCARAGTGYAQLRWPTLLALSVLFGGGASVMHYIGMGALAVSPAMSYDLYWVAASVTLSITGSALALFVFRWLPADTGQQRVKRQLAVATLLGGSVAGMHYLGMAAVGFAMGTVCLTSEGFDPNGLDRLVALAALVLLTLTLALTTLERRVQRQSNRLRGSLDKARDELAYITFHRHHDRAAEPAGVPGSSRTGGNALRPRGPVDCGAVRRSRRHQSAGQSADRSQQREAAARGRRPAERGGARLRHGRERGPRAISRAAR